MSKQVTEVEERLQDEDGAAEIVAQRKKARRLRRTLEEGDKVLVKTLNTSGTIVSLAKKEAEVAVGRLHMRVQLADLELLEPDEEKEELESGGVSVNVTAAPNMELDLRGLRVPEGLSRLDSYLDSAYLASMPWVRIIHGKGTGRMKDAVRKALDKNQRVSSWEEGKDGEGGAGVTVVKFSA